VNNSERANAKSIAAKHAASGSRRRNKESSSSSSDVDSGDAKTAKATFYQLGYF